MSRPLKLEDHTMTQEEVAERLGVSRARVQQLETAALGKLRRALARKEKREIHARRY